MLGRRDFDDRKVEDTSSEYMRCQADGTIWASNDLPVGRQKVQSSSF